MNDVASQSIFINNDATTDVRTHKRLLSKGENFLGVNQENNVGNRLSVGKNNQMLFVVNDKTESMSLKVLTCRQKHGLNKDTQGLLAYGILYLLCI